MNRWKTLEVFKSQFYKKVSNCSISLQKTKELEQYQTRIQEGIQKLDKLIAEIATREQKLSQLKSQLAQFEETSTVSDTESLQKLEKQLEKYTSQLEELQLHQKIFENMKTTRKHDLILQQKIINQEKVLQQELQFYIETEGKTLNDQVFSIENLRNKFISTQVRGKELQKREDENKNQLNFQKEQEKAYELGLQLEQQQIQEHKQLQLEQQNQRSKEEKANISAKLQEISKKQQILTKEITSIQQKLQKIARNDKLQKFSDFEAVYQDFIVKKQQIQVMRSSKEKYLKKILKYERGIAMIENRLKTTKYEQFQLNQEEYSEDEIKTQQRELTFQQEKLKKEAQTAKNHTMIIQKGKEKLLGINQLICRNCTFKELKNIEETGDLEDISFKTIQNVRFLGSLTELKQDQCNSSKKKSKHPTIQNKGQIKKTLTFADQKTQDINKSAVEEQEESGNEQNGRQENVYSKEEELNVEDDDTEEQNEENTFNGENFEEEKRKILSVRGRNQIFDDGEEEFENEVDESGEEDTSYHQLQTQKFCQQQDLYENSSDEDCFQQRTIKEVDESSEVF